jgi:hypothetical protein
MLPKPLYETLPYLYFLVGSALWIASNSPLQIIAGMLLYFAGAQQWVLRSNYRRPDRVSANLMEHPHHGEQQTGLYPRWLYEILPFLYIGLGYQLANLLRQPQWQQQLGLDSAFTLTASFCLLVAGYLVLLLRGLHRFGAHATSHHERH